jgi:hypothetical protein
MPKSDAKDGAKAPTAKKPKSSSKVEQRLEPLEEFRGRAEGWMKEVTAQVARLASSFEQEDKRRLALEDRLSDIEERIRSLLTLTELVSLDKNPFAAGHGPKPVPSAATPKMAPEAEDVFSPTAEEAPAAASSEVGLPQEEASAEESPAEAEVPPAEPFPAEGRPGVEVIPIGPPSDKVAPEWDDHEEQPLAAESSEEDADSPEGPEPEPMDPAENPIVAEPETVHPKPASEPSAVDPPGPSPQDFHPNDAAAEPTPPSPGAPANQPSHRAVADDSATRKRMLVIEWADLLAPYAAKIDVEAFTAFYVDAQWVDSATAGLVQRLCQEMASHVPPVQEVQLKSLHAATVRLLAENDPELPTFSRVDSETSKADAGKDDAAVTEVDGPLNAT